MDAELWVDMAIYLFELDKSEEALKCFDKVIELQPPSFTVVSEDKIPFYEKLRYGTALRYIDDELELDPSNEDLLNYKALCLRKLGRFEESLALFDDSIIVVDYDDTDFLEELADTFYDAGLYEEALDQYNHLIEIVPNSNYYWKQKGECLKKLDEYEEAKKCFEKVEHLGDEI